MPRCLGKQATIVAKGNVQGTAHADVIVSGPGADRIAAGGGNDRICAAGDDDVIEGGTGSDRIDAGGGEDEVVGGNGSDLVLSGPGTDTVVGKRGNDNLKGGPGAGDFLDSGLGDDTLDGGPGDGDQVIGGVGNDRLSGGSGEGDVLEGDLGTDLIDGGPAAHDTASYALAGSGQVFLNGIGVEVDLGAGTAQGDGEDTLRGIEDVVGTPSLTRSSATLNQMASTAAAGSTNWSESAPATRPPAGRAPTSAVRWRAPTPASWKLPRL